jgi:hypothetical protein
VCEPAVSSAVNFGNLNNENFVIIFTADENFAHFKCPLGYKRKGGKTIANTF